MAKKNRILIEIEDTGAGKYKGVMNAPEDLEIKGAISVMEDCLYGLKKLVNENPNVVVFGDLEG